MRPILRLACAAAAIVLALPGAARAQNPQPKAPSAIGLRAYGIVDADTLAAKDSFEAVLGTSRLTAFGGGVDVTDIWRHVFVRVAATHASKTGSRVFVSGTQVFPLGIPLTVAMTPIEAGGGWRFASKAGSRITPYAGVSFLSLGYTETSSFADAGENTSERFTGQSLFGGVDVGIVKWIAVAAEVQYRRVPNAIGAGGVSKDFDENDLGGFTARITIGIRTKR
jgi:hypothetical protein